MIGYTLLRDPHFNKGLVFTEKERDAPYLHGLLPQTVISQETQVKKMIQHISQSQVPLQKYITMVDPQVSELKKLVEEGKVSYIGLSEASKESTCSSSHSTVQIVWSLYRFKAATIYVEGSRGCLLLPHR